MENAQKNKEFSAEEKTQEISKKQGKEGQGLVSTKTLLIKALLPPSRISLEEFNPESQKSPQKEGLGLGARLRGYAATQRSKNYVSNLWFASGWHSQERRE